MPATSLQGYRVTARRLRDSDHTAKEIPPLWEAARKLNELPGPPCAAKRITVSRVHSNRGGGEGSESGPRRAEFQRCHLYPRLLDWLAIMASHHHGGLVFIQPRPHRGQLDGGVRGHLR